MSTLKQVKVDNWGVFFLQRLKHFFNRTDYCDLTLQFQDFAQLKVHRLVLNACTEYFEILESTCEKYEDYLIMPDDLQVDVVVPIINFMYTGQLEYDFSLYDRLYSTAQVMNMSVLTKLLDAQKIETLSKAAKQDMVLMNAHVGEKGSFIGGPSTSFQASTSSPSYQRKVILSGRQYGRASGAKIAAPSTNNSPLRLPVKKKIEKPRPTRYEVPEELEGDELFESSFADISYESRPLMKPKKRNEHFEVALYDEASCSKKFEELQAGCSRKRPRLSSDECDSKPIDLDQANEFAYQQKIRSEFADKESQSDDEIFDSHDIQSDSMILGTAKDNPNSLFSQLSENSSNVSFKPAGKTPGSTQHAKIISEVLKKYPHLVKTNTNIKLKVWPGFDVAQRTTKSSTQLQAAEEAVKFMTNKSTKNAESKSDWSYVSKNMNSEAMAKLVALGVANITGPWLCLMCGTPGKALSLPTYNKYYHHLVRVHKEKISANICEHCGYKSGKRNHLLHHMYTKHNVPPPSTHSFPKCNQCDYIALTEAFLIKHKMSHFGNREFCCNVCNSLFRTRTQLLNHIQSTGHKISPDRKTSNQCVYCNKMFLRENNLYTHLKLAHKEVAQSVGIIDNSDEEDTPSQNISKYEDSKYDHFNTSLQEERINIKQEYDGKIQYATNIPIKKPNIRNQQVLLNSSLLINKTMSDKPVVGRPQKPKVSKPIPPNLIQSSESEALGTVASGIAASLGLVDRFVVLNDSEYVLQSGPDQSVTMDQSIEDVQIGLSDNQEVILSDLPGDDFSTHYTIEVSMPQQTTTSQIMTSKTVKLPTKSVLTGKSSIPHLNQPFQTVITGNQAYKGLVSTAPLIYNTSVGSITTAAPISPKYVQSQTDNLHLDNTEGAVMVLQNDEFNMAQSLPNDGSNIVVVYSHPLESNGKQFVQVDQNHFANMPENHSMVTDDNAGSEEQLDGENTEAEVILSEHGLVHETVETWQDENMETSHIEEKEVNNDETVQTSEEVLIHEEIPISENVMSETIQEPVIGEEETKNDDNTQHLTENETPELMETVTSEVVITTPEVDKSHSDNEISENIGDNEENIQEDICDNDQMTNTESYNEVSTVEQCEIDENPQENLLIMETEEALDNDCSENNPEKSLSENTVKQVEKLASEWSDEEVTSREVVEQVEIAESASEVVPQNTEHTDVEESIENIEKEVQKHIQEKDTEAESDEGPSPTGRSTEETQDDESALVMEDQGDGDSQSVGESSSTENQCTPTLKQKTVEKISNLLNDWDDNDSQSDAVDTTCGEPSVPQADQTDGLKNDEKNIAGANPPDTNIHKLVSDWDDDDDK